MSSKKHKSTSAENPENELNAAAAEGNAQDLPKTDNVEEVVELELPEQSADSESKVDELTAQLAEMQKKYESQHNDSLRLMADFDNFRKRTLKEKAELLKNGGEDALKKLLPVVDDFERAMAALEGSNDVNAVKEGVELIYSKFRSYLENNGVKEIPAIGESFNDDIHEAITTFPAPTPEQKGKVIDCMTKGYTLNDKVIRHSKVVVGE